MFLLSQLLLVLSAYILLLALNSTQFLISSANPCLCWAPIFIIYSSTLPSRCLLHPIDIYLYAHLLYVDHCWFCSLDGKRVSERVSEMKKKEIMWSVTIVFWMVYCNLHWRRSRTPSRSEKSVDESCLFAKYCWAVEPNFIKRKDYFLIKKCTEKFIKT